MSLELLSKTNDRVFKGTLSEVEKQKYVRC